VVGVMLGGSRRPRVKHIAESDVASGLYYRAEFGCWARLGGWLATRSPARTRGSTAGPWSEWPLDVDGGGC